eukprot:4948078-Heterocapsa_arctica.AAC.1
MLDDCGRAFVTEHSVEGQAQMALALALADTCQAKNATIERNGRTSEQVAFARSLRWMSTVLNDDDDLHLSALDAEGEALRSTLMRATA